MSEYITVTARVPGFRRAGRAWPAEETTVPVADFGAEEIAALRAEPNLVVVDAPGAPAEPSAEERAARLLRAAEARLEIHVGIGVDAQREADVLGVLAALDGGAPLRDVTPAEADAAEAAISHTPRGGDPGPGSEAVPEKPVHPGDDPAAGSDPAAGDPARRHAIVAAMDRLESDRADHWTGTGKPRLDILRLAGAPEDLTTEERVRVWAEVRPAR